MKKRNFLFRMILSLLFALFLGLAFSSNYKDVNAESFVVDGITFDTELNSTNASGALTPGNYYLSSNLSISSSITCSGDLNIYLNDYVLELKGDNSNSKTITVTGNFGIYDKSSNETVRYFTGSQTDGFSTLADGTFDTTNKELGKDYVSSKGGVFVVVYKKGTNSAAIQASGNFTFKNVDFIGNTVSTSSYTNSIFKVNSDSSEVNIDGCNFIGGTIYSPSGAFIEVVKGKSVSITNSKVEYHYNNNQKHDVFLSVKKTATEFTTLTVEDSEFNNNLGVGLFCILGGTASVTFESCTFDKNKYTINDSQTGFIYFNCKDLTVKDSLFSNSWGDTARALLTGEAPTIVLDNTKFDSNGNYHSATALFVTLPDNLKTGSTLTIKGSKDSNNSIFYNQSTISNQTYPFNNGAAIYVNNIETVSITDTVFDSNSAKYSNGNQRNGGAIALYKCTNISVEDSTFSDNFCNGNGGAMYIEGASKLDVKNTTFTSNSAYNNGGAIYVDKGNITLDNVTATSNKNYNKFGGFLYAYVSSSNKADSSLTVKGSSENSKSIYKTNESYYYGGVFYVENMASVTIQNTTLEENKNTYTSGYGAGAAYFGGISSLTIENSNFLKNSSTTYGSLYLANLLEGTITSTTFTENKTGLYGAAIYMNNSSPSNQTLALDKCTFTSNTLSTSSASGALYATNSYSLSLNECTFTSNKSSGYGSAIGAYNISTMSITESTFTSNESVKEGGALYLSSITTLTVDDTTLTSNFATGDCVSGGAMYMKSVKNITITDSSFTSNHNKYGGGAIYTHELTSLTIKDTLFDSNYTETNSGFGGAIAMQKGVLVLENVTATSNYTAGIRGGFLYYDGVNIASTNTVEIKGTKDTHSIIKKNSLTGTTSSSSDSGGGALFIKSASTVSINYVDFSENASSCSAGAIKAYNQTTLNIKDCNFEDNKATRYFGGAIGIAIITTTNIEDCLFENNKDTNETNYSGYGNGGALYISSSSQSCDTNIKNTIFNENTASNKGGAIYQYCGTLTLDNVTGTSNSASNGGFLYSEGYSAYTSSIIIKGNTEDNKSVYSDNKAKTNGGVINTLNVKNISVNDSEFKNNSIIQEQSTIYKNGSVFYCKSSTSYNTELTVKDSNFTTNKSLYDDAYNQYRVGVVYLEKVNANFESVNFKENEVSNGTVNGYISTLKFKLCKFEDNKSETSGGAIYTTNSNLEVDSTLFKNNSSKLSGGAIFSYDAAGKTFTIKSSDSSNKTKFTGNHTSGIGGAVYVNKYGTMNISDTIIDSNYIDQEYNTSKGSQYSALYATVLTSGSIKDTEITNNINYYSDDELNVNRVGTVYIYQSTILLKDVSISNNKAGSFSGLYLDNSTCTFEGTVKINNNKSYAGNYSAIGAFASPINTTNDNLTLLEISGNESKGHALYCSARDLYLKKCKIINNISETDAAISTGAGYCIFLYGTAVINGNKIKEGTNEKLLDFRLPYSGSFVFNATDTLKQNDKFYFILTNPSDTVASTNVVDGYQKQLICQNEGYTVLNASGNLYLHKHVWVYTASFNKITFTCYDESDVTYSMLVNYNTRYYYNNSNDCVVASVTLTDPNSYSSGYKIKYQGRAFTSYELSEVAPTEVGQYYLIVQYDLTDDTKVCYFSFDIVNNKTLMVNGVNLIDGGYLANGEVTVLEQAPANGGYVYYDKDNNVLTLNNAVINKGSYFDIKSYDSLYYAYYISVESGIFADFDLTIKLVGENKIATDNFVTELGTGSTQKVNNLTVYKVTSGITGFENTLTFESENNAKLIIDGSDTLFKGGISSFNGNLVFNGGDYEIKNAEYALYCNTIYENAGETSTSNYVSSAQFINAATVLPKPSKETAGLIKINSGNFKYDASNLNIVSSFALLSSDITIGNSQYDTKPNLDIFASYLFKSEQEIVSLVKVAGSHNFNKDSEYPFFSNVFYLEDAKKDIFPSNQIRFYGDFEIVNGVITKASIPVQVTYTNTDIDVKLYYLLPYGSTFELKKIKDSLFEKGYILKKYALGGDLIDYTNDSSVTFDNSVVNTENLQAKLFALQLSLTGFVSEIAKRSNDYTFTVDVPEYLEEGKSIEYKWYTTKTALETLPLNKIRLSEGQYVFGSVDANGWITSELLYPYQSTFRHYYGFIPAGFSGNIYIESSISELAGSFKLLFGTANSFEYDETSGKYKIEVASQGYIIFETDSPENPVPKIKLYSDGIGKDELISNCNTNQYTGEEIVGDKILIAEILFKTGENVDISYTYQVKFGFLHTHEDLIIEKELSQSEISNLEYDNEKQAFILEGDYYLTSDISLNGNLIIPEGKEAYICLNSHTINLNGFTIINYGTLSFDDCHEEGELGTIKSNSGYSTIILSDSSIFNFHNGKVDMSFIGIFLTVEGKDVEINIYNGDFNLVSYNSSSFVCIFEGRPTSFTLNIYDGNFHSLNKQGTLVYYSANASNENTDINIYKATIEGLAYVIMANVQSMDSTKTRESNIYFGDVVINGCYKVVSMSVEGQYATLNINVDKLTTNNNDYVFSLSMYSGKVNFNATEIITNSSDNTTNYYLYCNNISDSTLNVSVEKVSTYLIDYFVYIYSVVNSTVNVEFDYLEMTNSEQFFEVYTTSQSTITLSVYAGLLTNANGIYFPTIQSESTVNINMYDTVHKFNSYNSSSYNLYFSYIYASNLNINLNDCEFTNIYSNLYFSGVSYGSNVVVNFDDVTIDRTYYCFYFGNGIDDNTTYTVNFYNAIIKNCTYNLYCDVQNGSVFTFNMYEGSINNCSYYGMFLDTINGTIYLNLYGGEIVNNDTVYAYGQSGGEHNITTKVGRSFKTDALYFYPNYGIDYAIGEGIYAIDDLDVTVYTEGSYNCKIMSYKDSSLTKYFKVYNGYLTYEYNEQTQMYDYYAKQAETISISLEPQSYLFDNEAKSFEIFNSSLSGFTVQYYENDNLVTSPTNKGTYKVVISREADQTYAAYSATIENGLQIKEANTISDFTVQNYLEESTIVVSAKSLSDTEGTTILFKYARSIDGEYSLHIPTRPGTYYCKAISQDTNEYISASEIKEFTISHDFEFFKFVWDKENKTAVAVYRCSCHKKDNHNATITSETTLAPTYKATGIKTYTATYDGHVSTMEEILPMLVCTHDYVFTKFIWNENNHTAKALYTCSGCQETKQYVATITSQTTLSPSCLTTGTITYTATYDGHIDTLDGVLNAIGHDYEFFNITWDGYTAKANYKCSNDASHVISYDCVVTNEITLNPTCGSTGTRTYTATYDNHTDNKLETLGLLSHDYEFVNITWDGYTAKANYKCSNDASHVVTYECVVTNEITLNPTCGSTGTRTYTATYDNHSDNKLETLGLLSHDYEFVNIVWDGYTAKASYKCSNDASHVVSYECVITNEITVSPTCEASGKKTYTATYDGHTLTKDEALNALGHNYQLSNPVWSEDNKSCSVQYSCLNNESHGRTVNGEVTIRINNNKVIYTAVFEDSHISIPNAVKEVSRETADIKVTKNAEKKPSVEVYNVELVCGSLDSVISVVISDSIEDIEDTVNSSLKSVEDTKNSKLLATFDIHLVDQSGQTVQNIDGNKYRVSIVIPEEFRNKNNLRIIYINDNNEIEVYDSSIESDVIIFETEHFSNWGIISDTVVIFPWWIILIVIAVLIIICLGLYIAWRKEYDTYEKKALDPQQRKLKFLDGIIKQILNKI